MPLKFWNIGKANAEIESAAAALTPALKKAGIETISIAGKAVPASEAPLANQIASLLTAQPVMDGAQNAAEALASNDLISRELESTKTELALKTTAVESLSREKSALTSRAEASESTVQDLTVKNTVLKQERDACSNQFAESNRRFSELNMEISKLCLGFGCLSDLKDADGKALNGDATEAQKLEAANRIAPAEKLTAAKGAIHGALARVGVDINVIPGQTPRKMDVSQANIIAQYDAIKDPNERARFRMKHASALYAAAQTLK